MLLVLIYRTNSMLRVQYKCMVGSKKQHHKNILSSGFTIAELIISISVIGVLSVMSFVFLPSALQRARNSEKISDTKSLSRFFEQRYKENASITYPTYPSTATFSTDLNVLLNSGLKDAAIPPGKSTNGVIVASSNTDQTSAVDLGEYIYQPLSPSGALCTTHSASSPCTHYKIWYRIEDDPSPVRVLESRYQQ